MNTKWWEVTFYDGTRASSDDHTPAELPDKPIIIVIQMGYEAPEILVNGAQWYFDRRYGWMEMENDFASLSTKLRIEVQYWECYRPGWWEPRKKLWSERWKIAKDKLEKVKAQ